MELSLKSSVQYLPRVGPTMAKRLEKLGIKTVSDLLYYVPFRYNNFSLVSPISCVQPGEIVTISGLVESMKNVYTKTGKKIQQARVSDASGTLEIVWFNQPFLVRTIKVGSHMSFSGPVRWFGTTRVLESPEYELTERGGGLHTGRLVPVYSETAGVSSKWLRGRIAFILEYCKQQVFEYLPSSIITKYDLIGVQNALQEIHFPQSQKSAALARHRLAFDELFLLQLRAAVSRMHWQKQEKGIPLSIPWDDVRSLIASLPFTLTSDQKQAVKEVLSDLVKNTPMNRLLEGDVGSGKTVVAAIAMYVAFLRGYASVLMAPTQILAQQHFETISRLLSPFGVTVELITSDTRNLTSPRPSTSILVGTHALLSEKLQLTKVGLVVIDEQQRFGVEQRGRLRTKSDAGQTPHFLTMTATPIPRTVAKTLYSHLDLSLLAEMPKGRQKVKTWVVPKEKRERAYAWIRQQLKQWQTQAFIVCPLIEESESLQTVKAATVEFERLKKEVFPDLRLGLLHGRLKPKEKKGVIARFRHQELDILVTTPVVEVGIDIPDATIMLIEASERFGLSQLHQLRGRVGRGLQASYCLLFTEMTDDRTFQRLKSLETIHNGPELAELDLKLRGPGELFGTKQHGLPELKIASLADSEIIYQSQQAVHKLMEEDATLAQFPLLREKLEESKIEAVQD